MTTLILKGIFLAGLFVITIALGRKRYLKGLQFTCWILCGITAGLCFPEYLLQWGPINLRDKALLLFIVQAVMFGMGTQLRLGDFAGLKRMRFAVAIGMLGQFTIMPLMGFALTHLFQFEPEIAAGLILMGSCSSGLASNVMAYLAGANLALSITMTACATLMAPIMTPLWMKLLAGELITVDAWGMMQQIISIVLIPISAALWPEAWKNAGKSGKYLLRLCATSGFIWHFASACLPAWHSLILEHWGIKLIGSLLGACLMGSVYHWTIRQLPTLKEWMPSISMFGILYFTVVTTAAGQKQLLQIGHWLLLAAILHNLAGYVFGYGLGRACRLDEASSRAIAFEVAMQNGGMASGLAGGMGKLATVGLAAAIFSPWMNISGSILAYFWSYSGTAQKHSKDACDDALS
jgi:BASS family bile acid:Na+ symporter